MSFDAAVFVYYDRRITQRRTTVMTLDKDALGQAEVARQRLLDVQHSAEVARVDYHHTIRKLHAAGGSLREIAEALGLSHQRVHQIVEPVDGSTGADPEPAHRVRRRMRGLAPFERFTGDARDVVAKAIDQAAAFGHRRVGTEHLAISLAEGGPQSAATAALAKLGVTREVLVAAVGERLGSGTPGSPGRRPFTPAARRVLGRAIETAKALGDKEIGSKHLLLGVVGDGGDGAQMLAEVGATPDRVREALGTTATP